MINFPPTIPNTNSDKLTIRRIKTEAVQRVGKVSAQAEAAEEALAIPTPRKGRAERRRNKDRRKNANDELLLDSRSGRGRRKSDRVSHPSIDIKA